MMLVGCLVHLGLALLLLLLAVRLTVAAPRRSRVLPLLLVFGCLATHFVEPHLTVDLHLMLRVYRAGGPDAVNEWAQGLIRERGEQNQDPAGRSDWVADEQLPPNVRAHLSGSVSANRDYVRIERGGGFYHYGVFVIPKERAPAPARWQRTIGWPPEVFVYHED
jgi:hypothetical protein